MGQHADPAGPALRPVAAALLALAGVRAGETVVDLGCGTGLLTHPAAAAAGPDGRVYGVDGDPAVLAAARARRPSGVRWLVADPARLPFAAGRVDKVLCGTYLHRLADAAPALAEAARVLGPGGRIVLSVWDRPADGPHEAALREVTGDAADVRLRAGGTAHDAAALPALLNAAGLTVRYDGADDVVLPFEDAAAYARWRLAFAGADPGAAARVAELAGPGPVLVRARVRLATAVRGRT